MQSYNNYVGKYDGETSGTYGKRAFQEALFFELINSVDKLPPDDAAGVANYQHDRLSFDQKCRTRRQAFQNLYFGVQRENNKLAVAHSRGQRMSETGFYMDDPEQIINAFFDTPLGKSHASLKDTMWGKNSEYRKTVIDRIHAWSDGRPPRQGEVDTEPWRIVVSPYDPMFSGGDLFGDASKGHVDELGYVVGKMTPDGAPELDSNGMAKLSKNTIGVVNGQYYIKAVVPGSNQTIADPKEMYNLYANSGELAREIDGPIASSGYNIIKPYIKTRKGQDKIKELLINQMEEPNMALKPDEEGNRPVYGPPSAEELEFMGEVCDYLTRNCIPFDIDIGLDNKLVAKLDDGSKCEITILSRKEPQYQGRIYDSTNIMYLGESGGNGGAAGRDNESLITNKDKMNMVKWYFGETVPLDSEMSDLASNRLIVGEYFTYANSNFRLPKTNAPGVLQMVQRQSGGTDKKHSMTLSIKKRGNKPVPINVMISSSNTSKEIRNDDREFAKSLLFTNDCFTPELKDSVRELIPVDKAYPSDIEEVDGERRLRNDISDPNHIEYYRHLIVRERLNDWVEQAKENHRKLVDIDKVIAGYIESKNCENYEFEYSSDEKVAEIQKRYWNVLSGEITVLHEAENPFDEDEDRKAVDRVVGPSIEERIQAIRDDYDRFVETRFGSVPELIREGIDIQNTSRGFRPSSVAMYVDNADSHGVRKNHTYIEHMLKRLGDDYNDNFVIPGDYVDNEIKNHMIHYDSSKVAGSLRYWEVMDATNHKISPNLAMSKLNMQDKPFTAKMLMYTAQKLVESGCKAQSVVVSVDENGIIKYEGVQSKSKITEEDGFKVKNIPNYSSSVNNDAKLAPDLKGFVKISGEIGQIFEPDKYGALHPNYAVPTNKVIIPGYDAYIVPDNPDAPQPLAQRLRLVGYEQMMQSAIAREIHRAAFPTYTDYDFVNHSASLNSVYKKLNDTVIDEDVYAERLTPVNGRLTDEQKTFARVVETFAQRCRFPNEYSENASTMAQSMLDNPDRPEAQTYDYYYSDLLDNHNIRVLDETFDGIFDETCTGNATLQGQVRYLVKGAVVQSDGTVAPAPKNGRKPQCSLMYDDLFKYKYFNTWDRRLMATTQVMTALHTPRHIGTAMMNVQGWNFDDGYVVSKKFAEQYAIKSKDGGMRPLMAQDKLSDLNGNKGVIGKVADPAFITETVKAGMQICDASHPYKFGDPKLVSTDVSYNDVVYHIDIGKYPKNADKSLEEWQKDRVAYEIQKANGLQDMDEVLKLFRDNENLDVIMAPYSIMSRFNGGTIRSGMDDHTDLKMPNGSTVEGGIGYMDFIVVDMPADVKTHWYDMDAIMDGKGRKASAQLAWALQSKGADKIMNEFYGKNGIALDNLREYAIAIGLDFTEDLVPVVGYHPQTMRDEKRPILKLPEEMCEPYAGKYTKEGKYTGISMTKEFKDLNAEFRTDMLEKLNKSGGFMELPFPLEFKTKSLANNNVNQVDEEWFTTPATGQVYNNGKEDKPTYGMPVLPQSLRSGQEFVDGTTRVHDHTNRYLDIYHNACVYMACERMINSGELKPEVKNALLDKMNECRENAQSKFDEVTQSIAENRFNTKHNVVRDDVMASLASRSATAVWSADPRLDIDQVGMSQEHAKQLGLCDENGNLKPDASVLVWRDPVLHDGNIRYLKPVIDNSILGVTINPVIDKSFDGDFDGDSVAIVALTSQAAQRQAYSLFSVETNLLNKGSKENGEYGLYFQDKLDIASNIAYDDEFVNKYVYMDKDEDGNDYFVNGPVDFLNNLKHDVNELEKKAAALAADPLNEELAHSIKTTIRKKNKETGAYENVEIYGNAAINNLRKKYKNDLNKWYHDALQGVGTAVISFKDETTVMQSLEKIVASKAKGKPESLKDAADNLGIYFEYNTPSDNKSGINYTPGKIGSYTLRRGTTDVVVPYYVRHNEQRDKDKKIQETTAYKADNTSLGGMIAQKGVVAFRNLNLQAALELTYPVTQAILQSKHDPLDAKVKDKIVRFWGSDCWNGYRLSGDWSDNLDAKAINSQQHKRITKYVTDEHGEPIYKSHWEKSAGSKGKNNWVLVEDLDENGERIPETAYVMCTKDEWIAQMKGMFKAAKVDVNEDFIKDLADAMIRTEDVQAKSTSSSKIYCSDGSPYKEGKGRVMGLEEFGSEKGTLLDNLAYTGRLSSLLNEAVKSQDAYIEKMAPKGVDLTPKSLLGNGVQTSVMIKAKREEINRLTVEKMQDKSKAAEHDARIDSIKEEIAAINKTVDTCASFLPTSVTLENFGDAQRAETGKSKTLQVKINNKTSDNNKITYVETNPRPVGRTDSRLTAEARAQGGTYMGESEAEYRAHLAKLKSEGRASEGLSSGNMALPVADKVVSEPKQTVSQPAVDKAATVSVPDSSDVVSKESDGREGVIPPRAKPLNRTRAINNLGAAAISAGEARAADPTTPGPTGPSDT